VNPDRDFLLDIIEFIESIERHRPEVFEDFVEDEVVRTATIHWVQTIGEAASLHTKHNPKVAVQIPPLVPRKNPGNAWVFHLSESGQEEPMPDAIPHRYHRTTANRRARCHSAATGFTPWSRSVDPFEARFDGSPIRSSTVVGKSGR
jgi:hypothetical protein